MVHEVLVDDNMPIVMPQIAHLVGVNGAPGGGVGVGSGTAVAKPQRRKMLQSALTMCALAGLTGMLCKYYPDEFNQAAQRGMAVATKVGSQVNKAVDNIKKDRSGIQASVWRSGLGLVSSIGALRAAAQQGLAA